MRRILKMVPALDFGTHHLSTLLIVILLIVRPAISDKAFNKSNNFNKRLHGGNLENSEEVPSRASTCGSCRMREDIKNRNLEVIKEEVLRKMGFQKVPNITGRILPQVPPHYLAMVDQEHSMQSDEPHYKTGYSITEEADDYHAKTEKVLIFAQNYPRLRHGWRGHNILHFSISDKITKYHVRNATMYIYIEGVDKGPIPDVLLEIFKIYKASQHPDTPGMYKVFSRKISQPRGRGDWIKVDMTVTTSEWFKNPRENYGFVVNATINGKKVAVTDTSQEGNGKAPFVEISTMEGRRRTRRSVGLNCDDKSTETLCCRYPLNVNFEEFGWDFVIAPKRFDAFYCSGECPMMTMQRYPHTHLIQLATLNTAQPCCAARKMRHISMLYYDDQLNVVLGNLPGMVVDRCGCS